MTMDKEYVEKNVEVKIPELYRDYLDNFPFNENSFVCEKSLVYPHRLIVERTLGLRRLGFFGKTWPSNYLVIGGDGLGDEYFVDVDRQAAMVFLADHELSNSSSVVEYAKIGESLEDWIAAMESTNTEGAGWW